MRAAVFLALAACGPKPAPTTLPPLDPPPATVPASEPFALAAVAYEVDPFVTAPQVALPADARLEMGTITRDLATVGDQRLTYSQHTLQVVLNDDFERFEQDVAPRVAAAVQLPPGITLAWSREETEHAGPIFTAVVLHVPPVLTTADVAAAEDIAAGTMTIDLDDDRRSKTEDTHAAKITLSSHGAETYAAWVAEHAGHPIARLLFGRVVENTTIPPRQDASASPKPAEVASFVVRITGVPPTETRTAAAALAKAVAARNPKPPR